MLAGFKSRWTTPRSCGVLHRVAYPRQEAYPGGGVEAVAAGVFVQGEAPDELHGEERPAVFRQTCLVNLGDAGVVQAAEDLDLLGETLEEGRRQEARPDHLQCDRSVWAILPSLVNRAHAPFTDQAQHAVAAYLDKLIG